MEVDISGAKVFFTIPIDFRCSGKFRSAKRWSVSWIVMALITRTLHLAHKRFEDTEHLQTPGGGRNDCGDRK